MATSLSTVDVAALLRGCLRKENQKTVQRLIDASSGSPDNVLGPQYIPPSVAGGSATVATHGPQLANGGRASRIEVGTPNMNNDMTTDQSHKLHTLCHVKHKESTLGFCWSCSKQLPYGYFAMVNNKLCATIRCTCGKSFSTQSTRL